jgi:hypothetical protein
LFDEPSKQHPKTRGAGRVLPRQGDGNRRDGGHARSTAGSRRSILPVSMRTVFGFGRITMMGTERLIASLNLLMEQFEPESDDLHEVHFKVREIMSQLRAMGATIPEDLIRFERELTEDVEKTR